MFIQVEPWGGIVVRWDCAELELLIDRRDAWFAWRGRLLWRSIVGVA